jgi:hypothetical protein
MAVSTPRNVSKSNGRVRNSNSLVLGWETCPSCGSPVAVRQRVFGGIGRMCRRCCWFMLECSDGRVEEGGGSFYTWLSERIGQPVGRHQRLQSSGFGPTTSSYHSP